MTATDKRDTERERLIANFRDRCPDGCRCSFQLAADMLRADAGKDETIRKLREALRAIADYVAVNEMNATRQHPVAPYAMKVIARDALRTVALAATTQPVKDGGKES